MHRLLHSAAVLSILLCSIALISAETNKYLVRNAAGQLEIKNSLAADDFWLARAGMEMKLSTTGWDRFWVLTNPAIADDEVKSYAAGYLEGNLTSTQISNWYQNFVWGIFGNQPPTASLLKYMKTQNDWSREVGKAVFAMTKSNPNFNGVINVTPGRYAPLQLNARQAAFWRQVHYIHKQLNGLLDGYNQINKQNPLTFMDIYLMNSAGDLEDLVGYFSRHLPLNQQPPLAQAKRHKIQTGLDCSSFVKPVSKQPGGPYTDLVFGHTTWSEFYSMNRIYKQYNITFSDPWVKASYNAFSSRPAFLSSKDDFYITDAGLGSQETTNSVYNQTLYDIYLIPDKSVLCFQRSIVANRLANNGDDWTYFFSLYNSGTYNNQWMVIDTKRFVPGSTSLQPGTLWIIEQIPGFTHRADVTAVMQRQGYWPSYNVPFFSEIYYLSGYNGTCPTGDGSCTGYLAAPRSPMFARLQPSVNSLETLKSLMQHNAYLTDPESKGDPAIAISSRYDLRSPSQGRAMPFGGLDSKISSYSLLKNGAKNPVTSWAISGPTHQGVPAFSWANWSNTSHVGQPTVWNFDWQPMANPFLQSEKDN